jgi:hypothetical protein
MIFVDYQMFERAEDEHLPLTLAKSKRLEMLGKSDWPLAMIWRPHRRWIAARSHKLSTLHRTLTSHHNPRSTDVACFAIASASYEFRSIIGAIHRKLKYAGV